MKIMCKTLHYKCLIGFWICFRFWICQRAQYTRFLNLLRFWIYLNMQGIIPGFVWLCLNVSKISNLLLYLGAKRVGACESYPTSEIPKICSYLWCFFNNLFIFILFYFIFFIHFFVVVAFFSFFGTWSTWRH